MESPEDIEKALGGLMPSAISGKGQRSLEDLIDGLAAGEQVAAMPVKDPRRWPWLAGVGAAAAVLALAMNLPVVTTAGDPPGGASAKGNDPVSPEATPFLVETGRMKTSVPRTADPSYRIAAPGLGLEVARVDEAIRAHVPQLPEGTGFVVTAVDPGGPAEKAGVKRYDIFWKLGDQWLANEAQLSTLIRLHKDGDEMSMGVYRSGKELTLPVVLAGRPAEPLLVKVPARDPASDVPDADLPMKVLNPAERNGSIEAADGLVFLSLASDTGVAQVKISASDGTTIYEGPVYDLDGISQVPEAWGPRVEALHGALVHAIKGKMAPGPSRAHGLPPG